MAKTLDAATGRWREILTEIGGVDAKLLDGKHHKCPKDGSGVDRFRFSDKGGSGSFFCACSQGLGGMALLKCYTGREFGDLAKEIDEKIGNIAARVERKDTYADRLRSKATRATRSAYLESRGLKVPPGLQFARDVEYREDGNVLGKFDAMLAPVTRAGKFLTYHVTYLKDGRKAPVPCPRKILPGPSLVGGGVALYPPRSDGVIGVAEGIETAIAAHLLSPDSIPVHAALNTSMLAKWEPPAGTSRVIIFADHDENAAGQAAAWALCHKLRVSGTQAVVELPRIEDTDFNDELLRGMPT